VRILNIMFQDQDQQPSWYDGWPYIFSHFGEFAYEEKEMTKNPCVSSRTLLGDGAKWFSTNCSKRLPFVCKHTQSN